MGRPAVQSGIVFLLRAAGIGLKAAFLFFSSRQLTLGDFGALAVLNTTISLTLSFMGLNFHHYTMRLVAKEANPANVIANHFLFVAVAGLASYALMPVVLHFSGLRESLVWMFAGLIYLEHLCNEAYNMLIAQNRSVRANVLFFARIACAYLVPMAAITLDPALASVESILRIWLVSLAVLMAIVGVPYLSSLRHASVRLSWAFMRAGLRTCVLYLGVTVLARAYFTFDKFLLNHVAGESEVGVYNFFFSLAWTISALVETSIISPSTHAVVNAQDKRSVYAPLLGKVVGLTAFLTLGFFVCQGFVLKLLGKEVFAEQVSLFYTFALAGLCFSLAQAVMLVLYSKNKDSAIVRSFVLAFIVFGVVNAFSHVGPAAIATNTVVTSFALLVALAHSARNDFAKPELTSND